MKVKKEFEELLGGKGWRAISNFNINMKERNSQVWPLDDKAEKSILKEDIEIAYN